MNHTVVILAAGLGTRMRSKRAKVLHRAGGLALVEQVVAAARTLTPYGRIFVVTGHQAEVVEDLLQPLGVGFVRQQGQQGTGHALASCREAVPHDGLLTVLYGDTPLLTAATLARLRDTQTDSGAAATLITTTLEDPTGYGRILLNKNGEVTQIVEEKAATPEQKKIKLINSGIYCFQSELLWKHIGEIEPNAASGELYLTDMAEILARHGHRVQPMHVDDATELLGINTRVELAAADRILRARKNEELMLAGVTIERPETVTIDGRVEIGTDTIIEPFTRLLGATLIGEDCRIGAGAILENAVLGDRVEVEPYTLINDSRVDGEARVGPFARLRMDAHVGRDARVGNFVELKKTHLGERAKSQHLAYLGDAEIGDGTNIGAGTITCNYDGEKKHRTTIGARAFVGSNSTLVAPIEIGQGSYIGAGSVITDAVPESALALGRARQVVKTGWTKKKA
ncbi:MAG TPA: bifunctional UDP-N-acetylglucosamine diphosphorylase/glucosamine-1-phosphate N-acetyltransferase GlmU [Bryobacteraceae bacterium]|jgi:bifunctional UDP-N-acetylglucosamine pyrophosphorylase/glucosamine-1-phosphate N-acetyltransferase|nr:bifunctional UDP-N-acetylglucosamine diphosphorylase/glucosamine-1-phosphate N-acetyltransferase GlmU [Bryobacteraceae bacterium]